MKIIYVILVMIFVTLTIQSGFKITENSITQFGYDQESSFSFRKDGTSALGLKAIEHSTLKEATHHQPLYLETAWGLKKILVYTNRHNELLLYDLERKELTKKVSL